MESESRRDLGSPKKRWKPIPMSGVSLWALYLRKRDGFLLNDVPACQENEQRGPARKFQMFVKENLGRCLNIHLF